MPHYFSMKQLQPGEKAVVTKLSAANGMRRRLMDIGLVQHTTVECLGRSPGGDPSAYLIRGAVIAIRSEDCASILLTEMDTAAHSEGKHSGAKRTRPKKRGFAPDHPGGS